MPKEIIISVAGDQSRIAIVEDGELVELYVENPDNVRTIGDIYLGRVRRILPGIRAAFVDIGQKQDAFLHFSDLSDNLPELLALSKGDIPESRQRLTTAPDDPEGRLETESPEEQLATARRRDLQRARRKPDATEPTEKDNSGTAEAAPEEAAPIRRRRRRARSREAEETTARTPDTPTAPPTEAPTETATTETATTETATTETAAEEPTAEEPTRGRRRRRRRRRGRGGRTAETPAEPSASASAAETPGAGAPDAGAPDALEPAAAPSGTTEEGTPETDAPVRRRRRARRAAEDDTYPAEDEATETPRRRRARSRRAELQQKQPNAPSEAAPEPSAPPPAPEQAHVPETTEAPPPPRLAPSSRFVIDLTAKPGRVAPRREEEEEEEESSERVRTRRRTRSRHDEATPRASAAAAQRNGAAAQHDDEEEDEAPRKQRDGRPPESFLQQDQKILVKIIKEPISAKGSRVSTDISLAGRFLVLVPAADYVAVSKKIESPKERRRLRALARSLLPEGFGLIVRTVAEGRDAKALDTDLRLLLQRWKKVEDQLRQKPEPPVRLYEDVDMVSSVIRDLFSEDYDRIVIDDPKVYRSVKGYVQAVAPHMAGAVQLYQGKEPLFRASKIERHVRAAFEPRVPLPGGGYLFIETTEAMHVVDVNSGRAGRGLSQEENALRVNLEAAREIAKQLRLRDLGGIICIDFIDMRSESYRKKVYDELKREFRRDRAVTKLLPMSDFGVVEVTRQRLRPSITTTLDVESLGPPPPEEDAVPPSPPPQEPPPRPTASEVVGRLERWLETYRRNVAEQHRKRPILIRVHPFLAAYLQRGIPSLLTRWKFKTWLNFRLDVDETADPLAFSVRDEKSGKNLTRKFDPDAAA